MNCRDGRCDATTSETAYSPVPSHERYGDDLSIGSVFLTNPRKLSAGLNAARG
jgi:hypothetical protein